MVRKEVETKIEDCYHVPVMLHESLEGLQIKSSGTYVDVTFGGGGHARGILRNLGTDGTLYGFDQDADAEQNIPDDDRFVFVRSNFRYLYNFMRYHGVAGEVDGLLADLGVSSHHFDDQERGRAVIGCFLPVWRTEGCTQIGSCHCEGAPNTSDRNHP